MRLSQWGKIIELEWLQTPRIRPNVVLDAFVVMPNHFHGAVVIGRDGRGVLQYAPTPSQTVLRSPSQTLGAIVRGFKAATARRINEMRGTPSALVWQRNYYEHVVRSDDDMSRVREYIARNPDRWEQDENNPANTGATMFPWDSG